MKKTAFKTFVCSFVFSLFVILATNRVFFRTKNMVNDDINLPEKNITLFLKDKELAPIRLASLPAKKIILSNIADIPQKNDALTENGESFVSDIKVENTPLSPIDTEENSFSNETNGSTLPIPVISKEDIVETKNVIEEPSDAFVISDTEQNKKQVNPALTITSNAQAEADQNILAQKEDISLQENLIDVKIPLEKASSQKLAQFEKPTVNTTVSNNTNMIIEEKSEEIKKIKTEENISIQEANTPLALIPLENNQQNVWAKAEIKKADDANKNLVALNSKNIPISSMEAQKQNTPSTSSEVKDKAWKSMKEKYGNRKEDDPWVVAKGKKVPNNKLMLDDKKYKMSDEDVQKIFEANKKLSSDEAAENNLQLASKTVKNLLIPIPEEILNDENLTPQLISSPKNQEIKEELEAKGLIKQEEVKEETPKEVITSEATKTTTEADTTNKEGGILDSITSLFGKDKNATPEIGTNEDNEENTSSLFSAFTKKQTRLISKILPTEIRLSFQPNRAEISGQTLKWIKAFAQKTAEEPSVGLEIRIDGTSSPLLQRRRLNLLRNILLNEGATPEKINTVFTAREPNSFILRTIKMKKETINTPAKNNNRYMQW